jgi:hypothetical protein
MHGEGVPTFNHVNQINDLPPRKISFVHHCYSDKAVVSAQCPVYTQ